MTSDLEKELAEINQKLILPDFFSDYRRSAGFLKRKAEIERLLKKGGEENVGNSVILEIRAGVGGNEATLFAKDLFEMYKRFAQVQNWQVEVLDSSVSSLGGYKQVVFEISGPEVYRKLRNESGVHRVQRVPTTEKSGRIHTSTVSVAVLKKASESEMQIKPEDLEISFFRSGGPGGQNVNKVETAVRILHKPSGLAVASQQERSQARNREKAMEILRTKLLDIQKYQEESKIKSERRSQIGHAERSEKVRTYNFPQDRVTDHRINKSWGNIEEIMSGKIDKIIQAFAENDSENSKK